MIAMPHVLVLLSVRNDAAALVPTLDSIMAQEAVEVELLVCDDCSRDATWDILEDYYRHHANLHITRNARRNGGESSLINLLYNCVDADEYDWIALAKPGCIWAPDKLIEAAEMMQVDGVRACDASVEALHEVPRLYYAGVAPALGKESSYGFLRPKGEPYASLLFARNWAAASSLVMSPGLVKLLQKGGAVACARGLATWIHMVALYADGRVVPDSDRVFTADPQASADAELGYGEGMRLFGRDAATTQAISSTAQMLLSGYGGFMDAPTRTLVAEVAACAKDPKARKSLAKRSDLALCTPALTRKLRWKLRFGSM